MIASGPAYPDSSTCEQAQAIVKRYNLKLSPEAMAFLSQETPKSLDNVETQITGSVRQLCAAAEKVCRGLGYEPVVLTAELSCTARDAGSFLGAIARTHKDTEKSLAYIAGGETVVHLTGHGLGGRNQEIALAAAPLLDGVKDAAVFSVGSDGTDGPTDAAGGYCDGETMAALRANGIDVTAVLADNDAYHALKECGGLIITGPDRNQRQRPHCAAPAPVTRSNGKTRAGRRIDAARLVLYFGSDFLQLYPRVVLFVVGVVDVRAVLLLHAQRGGVVFVDGHVDFILAHHGAREVEGERQAARREAAAAASARYRVAYVARALAQPFGERVAHAEEADDFAVLPEEQARLRHVAGGQPFAAREGHHARQHARREIPPRRRRGHSFVKPFSHCGSSLTKAYSFAASSMLASFR